jgi:hypothetical protein
MRAMKWVCVGLLALGCAAATGCGGGDDDNNAPATDTTPTLVAPQQVTPADDRVFSTLLLVNTKYKVNFEWTAVPGAASYVLEVGGVQTAVSGTTATQEFGYGTYEWRVWAKTAAGTSGPASGKFSFTVKSSLILAI